MAKRSEDYIEMNFEQQLAADLWILDALLTGHDPRCGRGDWDCLGVPMEEFAWGGKEFYLSDGGYSRVVYSLESVAPFAGHSRECGHLFLTSNSTARVRDRWDHDDTQSTRRRIEQRIHEFINQQRAAAGAVAS